MSVIPASFSSTTSSQNGVTLHVVEGGRRDGERVVLLHGFPEHWGTWKSLMRDLADDGYGVAAPDLRGYGGSDKPDGTDAYAIDRVLDDVEGVITLHGHEKAHVVGHDWGGVAAWWLAIKRPHLVDKLVILNAPHPLQFLMQVMRPKQAARSSYMLLFGSPLGPRFLRAGDFAAVRAMLKSTARPRAYADDDVDAAVDALRNGGLEHALLWYRAALKGAQLSPRAADGASSSTSPSGATPAKVQAKTLVVWGLDDPVLGFDLVQGIERYVDDVTVVPLPKTSHWVQHDAPVELSVAVRAHLNG